MLLILYKQCGNRETVHLIINLFLGNSFFVEVGGIKVKVAEMKVSTGICT